MSVPSGNIASPLAPRRAGLFSGNRIGDGQSLVLIALVVCWLLFFNEIRGEWQVNPQYNYGYVVPLLTAALFWRRWPDRPPTAPGKSPLLPVVMTGLLSLQ